jgi:hypothetical protein
LIRAVNHAAYSSVTLTPGLGAHAYAEFGIPVIGVAKSRFRTATHAVPVVRGCSARPLFVTAAGMPAADAADLVRRMADRYWHRGGARAQRRAPADAGWSLPRPGGLAEVKEASREQARPSRARNRALGDWAPTADR